MASCVLLPGLTAGWNGDGKDTVTAKYRYTHDTVTSDIYAVAYAAQSASPNPLPYKRQRLSGSLTNPLYAEEFSATQNEEQPLIWEISVTYQTVQVSSGGGVGQKDTRDLHPLYWPATAKLDYIEKEYVIEQAKNVEAITSISRSANTLGPVVNGAGQQPQDPLLDTTRDPVIVISRNVSSLAEVLSLNETYQLTCNNTDLTVFGNTFATRTLKYLGTDSGDQQEFEGISYWPIETRIAILKTTDRIVDSLGFKYIDAGLLVNVVDESDPPQIVSEPVFIALDGSLAGGNGTTATTITYRYLTEVDYSPLLG